MRQTLNNKILKYQVVKNLRKQLSNGKSLATNYLRQETIQKQYNPTPRP